MPNATTGLTRAYVYDTNEKGWYIHEFPLVARAACAHGDYRDREYVHLGMGDGRIVALDEDDDTDFGNDITTEFTIGPFDYQSRKMKLKNLHLNAEPREDFSLDIYTTVDDKEEVGPSTVDFETGNVVTKKIKLRRTIGQNASIRITTTDRINELQKATISLIPKEVK